LIIESIQNEEPASATKAELESLIDERQQTLQEWYERSLIDTSTFDQESRERIQEVMDESEDVYGSESDIREFVRRGIEAMGGSVEKAGNNLYEADIPEEIHQEGEEKYGPFTYNRDFATDREDIKYVSPDDDLVQQLMKEVLDGSKGVTGLKILPFVDKPGITYNFRVKFEDGTGEVITEEMVPVYVDKRHYDAQARLGERVIQADSIKGSPDTGQVRSILQSQDRLRSTAESYISRRIGSKRDDLEQRRSKDVQEELDNLEDYADAERRRIQEFITEYEEKAESGSNMDIAIRKQRERLKKLEQRIDDRREELRQRAKVISLAPEVENICITLPT
jgi:hypothetical protein